MKFYIYIFIFIVILSGCSGKTAIWIIPQGISDEQLHNDDVECRYRMERDTIMSNTVASFKGGDYFSNIAQRARLYNYCMEMKGYRRGIVPRSNHNAPQYRYHISHPM